MKKLEEYIAAYETAMENETEWARTVFSPAKWIFYKWCDDEGIEELSDPTLEEKLQNAKAFDERLGRVLEKGIEELALMASFFSFENKTKTRKKRKRSNL